MYNGSLRGTDLLFLMLAPIAPRSPSPSIPQMVLVAHNSIALPRGGLHALSLVDGCVVSSSVVVRTVVGGAGNISIICTELTTTDFNHLHWNLVIIRRVIFAVLLAVF